MSISSTTNGNHPAYWTYKAQDDNQEPTADNSSRFGGDSSPDTGEGQQKPSSQDNPPASPPASTTQSTRGAVPSSAGGANVQPGTAVANQTDDSGAPTLPDVTIEELKGLSDRYDTDSSNGTPQSRSLNNDEAEKGKLDAATELDYTGYPPDVARVQKGLGDTQAQLAALPPEVARRYATQLAVYEAAYCNITSPEARSVIEQKLTELESAILQEYNRSINDPLDRVLSIFNHPLGEGYLDPSYAKQLAQLDNLRKAFLGAPNAAAREAILRQAADLKNRLQHAVADATDAYLKKDRAEWDDANRFVDQTLQDAEKIQDPVKRYKAITDALFSLNTGMGEDPVADKRVLAFTQRLQNDPDLRHKLDIWQAAAHDQLKAADDPSKQSAQRDPNNPDDKNGPAPVPSYSHIIDNPPPAGPDYIRDLADRFTHVGQQVTRTETAAAGGRPYGPAQPSKATLAALEAVFKSIAHLLLGLTPLAALKYPWSPDSAMASGKAAVTESAVNILLSLLDPILGALGDVIKAGGEGAQFARELGEEAAETATRLTGKGFRLVEKDGHLSLEEDGSKGTGPKGEDAPPAASSNLLPVKKVQPDNPDQYETSYAPEPPAGPSDDPSVLAAKARMGGKPMQIPEDYAVAVDPNTLMPDENAPGVYTNDSAEHFIKNDDKYYKVNYDSGNNTWRVIHPSSPGRYTYPVRFDPTGEAWAINTDVGLKGGGPMSRLVSLRKFAQDPPVAKLLQSKTLKPQNPSTCFLDHGKVAKNAADVPDGRLTPIANGPLNAAELRKQLEKGPLVLSARGIARPDSNYSGMHTIVLLKVFKGEDGKEHVLGIDLDDTIGRSGAAQSPADGDFGGVDYDLDSLTRNARPYVDEESGTPLEMYSRPQQSTGIWDWFKSKLGGGKSTGGESSPTPQPGPSSSNWVPDTYQTQVNGDLSADRWFPGIHRDSMGRGYIRQGDKTYAVAYDKDNATWRVVSPEGGAKPSYPVRQKNDGSWELNPEVGLPGGGRQYTDDFGKEIYDARSVGDTFLEIAERNGVSDSTIRNYLNKYLSAHPNLLPVGQHYQPRYTDARGGEIYEDSQSGLSTKQIAERRNMPPKNVRAWIQRYANEHRLPPPQTRMSEAEFTRVGPAIYSEIANGSSITASAHKFTEGNPNLAFQAALRYAIENRLPKQPVEQAWAKYLEETNRPAGAARRTDAPLGPVAQPEFEPMTQDQYDQILEDYGAGESSQEISRKTGVPEAWVKNVEHGYGYYSSSQHAYVEPTYDPENVEPPAKRLRTDPAPTDNPSSSSAGPSSPAAGPSGAGQAAGNSGVAVWGRAEMRQYLHEDPAVAQNMDPRIRDAITGWLEGAGPAPDGLQQEMIEQGFPNLTPAILRDYLNGKTLTTQQMSDVEAWLGI
ncbi:DUF6543 domain-containing protein [Paraburkholderia azotifigens]|uniref:DUF6543 domain-containing protein n=1 Tax=Paraburkholderia azotifigens TaxID=2057004 RepID=A0A5C6VS02_9BURK|nr:DUF6543 domain-containing protein [Paraburkholderia azotifigens]TXC86188.1 hypothetical protein FRZ40_00565 [Paraburkholderia azotifigens]